MRCSVIALAVSLAACGGRGHAPPTSATRSTISHIATPTDPVGTPVWLAVFRTAGDPADLNVDTRTLLGRVDGAIRVSPGLCFEGLPTTIAPSDYILGVAAPTNEELQQLVDRSGFPAQVEVEVTELCID